MRYIFSAVVVLFVTITAQASSVCGVMHRQFTCKNLEGCPQYFLSSAGGSVLIKPALQSGVDLSSSLGSDICLEGYFANGDDGLFFATEVHPRICSPNGCGGCHPSSCH